MTQDYFNDAPFGWSANFNETTLVPQAGVLMVVLGVMMLALPRRRALVPMVGLVCFVSAAQRVVVFDLDFTLLRILVLVAWFRIMIRQEYRLVQWCRPDTVMLLWAGWGIVSYSLLWGSFNAVVYILGFMFDALGMYFMIRCLVRSWEDVKSLAVTLVFAAAISSLFFINEMTTGRNLFSYFGGVPEYTVLREGRLRCQGALPHPILAGCFWAALAPFMAALFGGRSLGGRVLAVVGVGAVVVIIIACSSSTPVGSAVVGVLAFMWFPLRRHSRHLRYAVMGLLIVLHVSMNHPVWHLLARIDLVGGSTGYHRYLLIDTAINNFAEWALIGMKSTQHWGSGLEDITNQFILEGIRGGFIGLCLFAIMIWMAFSRVGGLVRSVGNDREKQILAWALGVGLFVHTVNFIGVSYFGQVTFAWYLSLGAIVSMSESTSSLRYPRARRVPIDGKT